MVEVSAGSGLDEKSAVLVEPDGNGTVVGTGKGVYFLRPTLSPEVCKPGQPLTFRKISVYRAPGRCALQSHFMDGRRRNRVFSLRLKKGKSPARRQTNRSIDDDEVPRFPPYLRGPCGLSFWRQELNTRKIRPAQEASPNMAEVETEVETKSLPESAYQPLNRANPTSRLCPRAMCRNSRRDPSSGASCSALFSLWPPPTRD